MEFWARLTEGGKQLAGHEKQRFFNSLQSKRAAAYHDQDSPTGRKFPAGLAHR
jgi:hypothetical protein